MKAKSHKPFKKVTLVTFKASQTQGLKIEFPFSQVNVILVKSLQGRKYNPEKRYWTVPYSEAAALKLIEWGFAVCEKTTALLNGKTIIPTKVVPSNILGLQHPLYPFQMEGVKFIEKNQGRALVADEMGLGKTVQALAWLQLHPEARPAIIVVPASLKLNWKKEAEAWMENPVVQVLSGSPKAGDIIQGDIIVINYDIVGKWFGVLSSLLLKVIILDEIHYLKNSKAQRSKAVRQLVKGVPHLIGLSGTPIVNRPIEAYNAISMISPLFADNEWQFAHRYCGAKNNGFGWDFSGSSRTEELHSRLTRSFMIRRLKKDVLKDLPDKVRSYIPMELDNRKVYAQAERDFIAFIREKTTNELNSIEAKLQAELRESMKKYGIESYQFEGHTLKKEDIVRDKVNRVKAAETLTKIEGLKQLAVEGKMEGVISWVRDFLESGEKLVIMAVHKFVIDRLMQEFGKMAVKIDGSVTQNKRQEAVEQFQQSDKIRLFIGNIKAAGVGITLTASSNVAIIELPWVSGDLLQCEDRCHRIGQKNTVNIYYLLAANTIEETIAEMLDKKNKVLTKILDGKEVEKTSTLKALMTL